MYEELNKIPSISFKELIESDLSCTARKNLNLFEKSIKGTTNRFEKKYNRYCEKVSEISDEILKIEMEQSKYVDNISGEYSELQNEKIKLYEKQHYYHIESYWIDQQLKSISEMQIINAFKNIEINIKTLINIAYPNVNTKEFYKWDSLIQFFKNKEIKISEIEGYKDIVNLKDLNNSLKHNGIINQNIKKIKEFKYDEEFTFVNLINFYEQVKKLIQTFLDLLAEEIKRDLFQFDEIRITKISEDLKHKLGVSEIENLIQKLKNK